MIAASLAALAIVVYVVERLVVPGIWPRIPTTPEPLTGSDEEAVPEDLIGKAVAYEEDWARDDALARYKELRRSLGSWDAVRRAVSRPGIEE